VKRGGAVVILFVVRSDIACLIPIRHTPMRCLAAALHFVNH